MRVFLVSSVVVLVFGTAATFDFGLELAAPTFSMEPEDITIGVEGNNVNIKCASDVPVTWHYENGEQIQSTGRFDVRAWRETATTTRLRISNVQLDDSGTIIICKATASFGTETEVQTRLEVKVPCSQAIAPEHGNVEIPNGPYVGETAFYSCDPGYSLVGESESLCQEDQTWQHVAPVCTDLEVIMNEKFSDMRSNFDTAINELEERIENLQGTVTQQEETINAQATLISTLEGNTNQQQEDIDSHQQSIAEFTTQLSNYNDLSASVNNLATLTGDFTTMSERISTLENDMTSNDLSDRIASLETACTSCSTAEASAAAATTAVQESVANLNQQLTSVQTDLSNSITSNTQSLATLQGTVSGHSSSQSLMESRLNNLEAATHAESIDVLETQLNSLIDLHEGHTVSLADVEREFLNLTSHLATITTNLEGTVSGHETTITSILQDLSNVNSEVVTFQDTYATISSVHEATQPIATLQTDVSGIHSTIEGLHESYATVEVVNTLDGRVTSLEENVGGIHTRLDDMDGVYASIESTFNGQIASIEGRLGGMETDVTSMSTSFATISNVETISSDVATLTNDVSAMQTTLGGLSQSYAPVESLAALQEEFASLDSVSTSFVTELTDDLNTRVASLETACTSCSTAEASAAAATTAVEESVASLNQQLTSVQTDLSNSISSNTQSLATLQGTVADHSSSQSVMESRLNNLEAATHAESIDVLETQLNSLIDLHEGHTVSLADVEREFLNLTSHLATITTNLEGTVSGHETTITSILQDVSGIHTTVQGLDQTFATVASVNVLNGRVTTLEENVNGIETAVALMPTTYATTSDVETISTGVAAINNNISAMNTILNGLPENYAAISEVTALQQEVASLDSASTSFVTALTEALDTRISTLETANGEVEALRQDYNSLQNTVEAIPNTDHSSTITEMQTTLNQVRDDLSSAASDINAIESTVSSHTQTLDTVQNTQSGLLPRINDLEQRVITLEDASHADAREVLENQLRSLIDMHHHNYTISISDLESQYLNISSHLSRITGNLEGSVSGQESTIETILQDITSFDTRITTLASTCAMESDMNGMTERVQGIENTQSSLSESLATVQADVASRSSANVEDLNTVSTDLQHLQTLVNENSDHCNSELAALQGIVIELNSASSSDLISLRDELSDRITLLETDCSSCATAQSSVDSLQSSLQADINSLQSQLSNVEGDVSANEGNYAGLLTRVTVNEQQISTVSTAQSTLRNEVTLLDANVLTNTQNIATLRTDVNDMNINFEPRLAALERLQLHDIDDLRAEVEAISQSDLEGRFANFTTILLNATLSIASDLTHGLARVQAETAATYAPATTVSSLQAQFNTLDAEVTSAQEDTATASNSVTQLQMDVVAIQTDLNLVQSSVNSLTNDLNTQTTNYNSLENTVNDMQNSVSSSSEVTSLQNTVSQLQSSVTDLQGSVAQYDSQLSSTAEDVAQLENDFETLNECCNNHTAEITELHELVQTNTAHVEYVLGISNYLWTQSLAGGVGQISSKYHPYHYPNDEYQDWDIEVQNGVGIEIHIINMDIEHHASCLFDNLRIYDGTDSSSNLVATYCVEAGDEISPNPLIVDSTSAKIVFSTDSSTTHQGFLLVYHPHYLEEVDLCFSDPCEEGSCSPLGDNVIGFTCDCDLGFNGTICDWNIDDCEDIDCGNGDCVDGIATYDCDCNDGYTGDHCEHDIDECAVEGSPCAYGECENTVGHFLCHCNAGYEGDLCDIDIDECASNPCVNGNCEDQVNSYECSCNEGWGGTHCEHVCNYISSPNYPGNYDNVINYYDSNFGTYDLVALEGYIIEVEFYHFDVENYYDKLYFYDGYESSTAYRTFTGYSLPAIFRSTGNRLTAKFVSDYSVTKTGFRFCWRTINTREEALDLDRCVISTAYAGDYTYCPQGYYSTAACTSPEYNNCAYNSNWYTTLLVCCPFKNDQGEQYWNTQADSYVSHETGLAGANAYCDSNEVVTEICSSTGSDSCYSGTNTYWTQQWYSVWDWWYFSYIWYYTWESYTRDTYTTTSLHCYDIPSDSGRQLSTVNCEWIPVHTWAPLVYCPEQYVIRGFCGSNDGSDCQGYSHAIYCCHLY